MSKKQTPICRTCGLEFKKTHIRQRYCCLWCQLWPRIQFGDKDDCWLWSGATNDAGYGQVSKNGVRIYVHRAMYEIYKGPLRSDLHALHSCDCPPCCNPWHLSAGTASNNHLHALMRNRWHLHNPANGERHHSAVLTESLVLQMRRAHAAGQAMASIARQHAIAKATARQAILGETWKHI